jgi:hypothetical protein
MKRRTATHRQRRSPEEIAELLDEYQRSELTQRAFADWKGLSLSSLSGFEILVAGDKTIRIPADFDEEALRRLLQVLEP